MHTCVRASVLECVRVCVYLCVCVREREWGLSVCALSAVYSCACLYVTVCMCVCACVTFLRACGQDCVLQCTVCFFFFFFAFM